jgi:hypothetical protein
VRPPFSPKEAIEGFVALLESYGIDGVVGDHWGGLFVRQPFEPITYTLSELTKSGIYRDALAILNSKRAQLLDHPRLITQLCGLERRTSRGGKDSIDHAPGAHDDVCNAAMGALLLADNGDRKTVSWAAVADDGTIYDRAMGERISAGYRPVQSAFGSVVYDGGPNKAWQPTMNRLPTNTDYLTDGGHAEQQE